MFSSGNLKPRVLLMLPLGAVLVSAAIGCGDDDGDSTPVPQPSAAQLKAAGFEELPLAPEDRRRDLEAAPFSDPTEVTNPLFPISELHSVILNGHVEGKPFRTETTLLPGTRTIEWTDGQYVETLVSQYAAYLDGRIEEVALDHYAQADDGSVWYFGEDVFNYDEEGRIADTSGTWLAGKEGPAAMIMPGDPEVGDVNRPENIPGLVFEEVAVKAVGKTVDGPLGPVEGAMVGNELHDDGTHSDKVFAPAYGEFFSAEQGDVEALALAVPTDALADPPPVVLEAILVDSERAFEASSAGHWRQVETAADRARGGWEAFRAQGEVPVRLETPLTGALNDLEAGASARDRNQAGQAAHETSLAALDIELRYLPPDEIDLARLDLWARRILVDASAGNLGGVSGDLATMEW